MKLSTCISLICVIVGFLGSKSYAEIPPLQVDSPADRGLVSQEAPSFGVLQPRIFEMGSIEKVIRLADSDTLYITDVDNTVLKSAYVLGSEAGGYYFQNELLKEGVKPDAAFLTGWDIFVKLREIPGSSVPVEPGIPYAIHRLQDQGTHTMALTAAMLSFYDIRKKELAYWDIDFNRLPPVSAGTGVEIYPKLIGYRDGIMMTSFQDKGASLVAFFQKIGWLREDCKSGLITAPSTGEWRPKKVIYVDDYLKLDISVSKALTACNIPHLAIRYGAADPTWTWNDSKTKVGECELDFFKTHGFPVSGDDAAAQLVAQDPNGLSACKK